MLCSLPGVRGTPGAWDGPGRNPYLSASGPPHRWGLWDWLQGYSFSLRDCGTHSLEVMDSCWCKFIPTKSLSLSYGYGASIPQGRRAGTMTRQSGLTEAIAGPLESSTLPTSLPKGPPVPCHISTLTLPSRAFKHINLKASSKEYACRECDKTSSNQDTMVSHCLQDHLGAHLVCPRCGMNYSDPSNFWCPGRELHNLLFY